MYYYVQPTGQRLRNGELERGSVSFLKIYRMMKDSVNFVRRPVSSHPSIVRLVTRIVSFVFDIMTSSVSARVRPMFTSESKSIKKRVCKLERLLNIMVTLYRIRYTKPELLEMATTLYKKTEGYSTWLDVVKKHLGQGKSLGDKFGGY